MKFLYQPIKPFSITQYFGEDKACIDIATGKKYVYKETAATCPVGFKSMYSMMKGHNGLDVNAYRWQPVYCAQSGRVDEVCTEEARGLGVGVRSQGPDGRWFRHRYWHFIALDVENGDELQTGDLLGYADSTGYSTGDHLHFEVKEVDKDGRVLNQNNGYFGAIDPLPLMENIYALDVKGWVAQIKTIREKLALIFDNLSDKLRNK